MIAHEQAKFAHEPFELTPNFCRFRLMDVNKALPRARHDISATDRATWKQAPKSMRLGLFEAGKIKEDGHVRPRPFFQESTAVCRAKPEHWNLRRTNVDHASQRFLELGPVCLSPRSVYDPGQLRVEIISRATFIGVDMGMLKFNHPFVGGLDIRDVLFAVARPMDDFLPFDWKPILPRPMPLGLVFPPGIATAPPFVSPVPNHDFPALCNHGLFASGTRT